MVDFKINTGDELPRKQAARRIPYAACQKVTEKLDRMQRTGVIRPSSSPWSSPFVLMRKNMEHSAFVLITEFLTL